MEIGEWRLEIGDWRFCVRLIKKRGFMGRGTALSVGRAQRPTPGVAGTLPAIIKAANVIHVECQRSLTVKKCHQSLTANGRFVPVVR